MRSAGLLPAGSCLAGATAQAGGKNQFGGGGNSAVPEAAGGGVAEALERHVQGWVPRRVPAGGSRWLGWRDGGVLSPSCSRSVSILSGVRSLPHAPMDLPNYSVEEARWAPVCLTVREDEFAVSQRQRRGNDAGGRE